MEKKKQKKLKIKNFVILGIILVLVILTIIFYKPVSSKIKLRLKGYSSEAASIIYDNDMTDKVLQNDFNY